MPALANTNARKIARVSTSPAAQPYTRAIVFLAVAGFASQAMVRSLDSLLPQIAGDFGTTVGVASIVVSAYSLMHGTMQLFMGPIGDRLRQISDGGDLLHLRQPVCRVVRCDPRA